MRNQSSNPAAIFCAILGLSTFAAQAQGAPRAVKLEGMGYQNARQLILSYGWKPVSAKCQGVSGRSCVQFPEIQSCSGVDLGYCGMVFIDKNRCLYLTTSGGEPEGQGESDTHVTEVSFRAGPCFKG